MPLRVYLCRVDDVVAGELRARAVVGVTWPVLVTRLDGEIVATAGVCPHEDVGLDDGELDGGTVVCPGHGYRFDLRTGACGHDPDLRLRRYPVTVVGDAVYVDLL
ncbi:MAG: Rieske 2Fe-2S domain-containing protein [Kofleriaceae bacterium]